MEKWVTTSKSDTHYGSIVRYVGHIFLYLDGSLVPLDRRWEFKAEDISDFINEWEVLDVDGYAHHSSTLRTNSILTVIQKQLNLLGAK